MERKFQVALINFPNKNQFRLVNKCLKKPKGQSRMENPEKRTPLGTQDTRRRKTKRFIFLRLPIFII